MLKKLQHNMFQLHSSDFRFCVIQTQLCTSDPMSNNCGWPGAVVRGACLEIWRSRVSSPAPTFRFKKNKMFHLIHVTQFSL